LLLFSFPGLPSINIYGRIGLITLSASCRNGILIVQFANHLQEQGRDELHAVLEAAGTGLVPALARGTASALCSSPA